MSRSGVTRTASVISKPASLTCSWRPIFRLMRACWLCLVPFGWSFGPDRPFVGIHVANQVGRTPNAQQLILASHRTSWTLKSGARVVGVCAMAVNREILSLQNSVTSAAIIEAFKDDAGFKKVAERLMAEIMRRDQEDGAKLAKGIQLAVDKKVLPADVKVEPTTKISVSGKSADKVADEIIAALGDAPSKGCVMTLQGLSGTGKGTTVDKLKEKLPNAQTWSNGNLFRSLTLLAVTCAEQKGCELTEVLTAQDLDSFCKMLEFGKFNGKWDVKIEGLGCKYFVSEVEKTVLKDSKVAKNIPTVAEVTQGEVVNFVQGALTQMAAGGTNVLLEGREQTLNHIRTPNRFELVLDEPVIIGMRQAALQMGAKAFDKVKDAPDADEAAVKAALEEALASLG